MDMQNITLSLPKKTLRKVKLLAVQRQTSISRLVTQVLEQLADEESGYMDAYLRQMKLMSQGFELGLGEKRPAQREELHER
jgi:hypothetical protein